MNSDKLHSLLTKVSKPSQYLGGEINVVRKDFDAAKVKVALIFPDKYEMGMSHTGLKILYDILNQMPGVVAERCFAPELDMEAELKAQNLPLFSLESKRPLSDFDILGFSLTYELTYTNMLAILDRGGIPIWQKDRTDSDPLVIAGGGCTMNAEPFADFVDAAVLGDGEEIVQDIVEAFMASEPRDDRKQFLNQLADIEGLYIPSLFKPVYHADGTLKEMVSLKAGYTGVKKRVVQNLDSQPYPTRLLVPSVKLIHDRIGIEIQRGCNRACRFCQAGYIDRPVRQRSPDTVLRIAQESYEQTGIDEISLLSLSAADYGCIVPLTKELNERYADSKVSISVPATRTEKLTPDLIEQVKKVRKTGFTIAPEAGSERMRRVINKGNKVDDLFTAVTNAFSAGYDLLKLYYMVGLPYEKDEDVVGIAEEANASIKICFQHSSRSQLKLSVSSFVPKPHTPFQWHPQMGLEETKRKYNLVKRALKHRRIRLSHHHPEMSYLEGIFSRGDRRVARLIELAYQKGCRFDEWQEHFDFAKWQQAIAEWDRDPDFYLTRQRAKDEVLPWDHLFVQMDKNFLWEELERAHDAAFENEPASSEQRQRRGLKALAHQTAGFTEDCSVERCSNCGVCDFRAIKNRVYVVGEDEIIAKKGHREWYGGAIRSRLQPKASMAQGHPAPLKIRVRFAKTGLARYMGHLELMGVLKRALTRLGVPVAHSQGFHPQMKLAMGYPLSLGIESEWEYFDCEITQTIDTQKLLEKMNVVLPSGLKLLSVEFVDRKTPSLYSSLNEVSYEALMHQLDVDGSGQLDRFEKAKEFVWSREKRGKVKKFDLKQNVHVASYKPPGAFKFRTKIQSEGSLKPQEVLCALFGLNREDLSQVRLKKIGISWKDNS